MSLILEGFDWSGKTGRGRFAIAMILLYILMGVGLVLKESTPGLLRSIGILALAASVIPSIGFQVRRFHDAGRSGAWVLLNGVPFLSILVLGYLLFAKSSDQEFVPVPQALARAGFGLCLFLTAVILTRLTWAPYWIPTGAMKPTLFIGDYLVVSVQRSKPELGDVAVFRHPTNEVNFIMRVLGLPGDRVEMRGGHLVINDVPVPRRDAEDFVERFERQGPLGSLPLCENAPAGLGSDCIKSSHFETLPNGVEYRVLDARSTVLDNTGVYVVPDGHFFVLGDNRDNSTDSRIAPPIGIGFVPFGNLIGVADLVLFSSSGRSLMQFWTWRGERFFLAIQ